MLYFYVWLLPMEKHMMNATSGGVIVKKTPWEARELISTMTANSKQFGPLQDSYKRVNDINTFSIESRLSPLTTLVQSLCIEKAQ